MEFNQDNEVIKLCVEGMEWEGKGASEKAARQFEQAWNISQTDFEKFTAAHYVARHQNSVAEKLAWDERALHYALKMDDQSVKGALPSLYLNVGKGYEDLKDLEKARANYLSAKSYFASLPDDGYGNLIRNGVESGIDRVREENR